MVAPESSRPTGPQFRNRPRKSISVSSENLVTTGLLDDGSPLPLVIKPAVEGVQPAEWATSQRLDIHAKLLQHGAILFRDFEIASAGEFESFAHAVCGELFGEYGDLPREAAAGKIYGSTVYPPDQTILFHNESSHLGRWPLKIFFYCAIPAKSGGETPLLDCRKIYQSLDPQIRERFRQKQLMYVRSFIPGLDVPWQEFFRTNDRAAVEKVCRDGGMQFDWVGEDGLKVSKVCPAIAQHPHTGEMTFFNQIQLHHIRCLDPMTRQSLLDVFRAEDLPRNVYFGDGTPIEDELMDELGQLYRENAVQFAWRQGDVVLLDNMMTAHSRNPFAGPRKILVALGEMHTLN